MRRASLAASGRLDVGDVQAVLRRGKKESQEEEKVIRIVAKGGQVQSITDEETGKPILWVKRATIYLEPLQIPRVVLEADAMSLEIEGEQDA